MKFRKDLSYKELLIKALIFIATIAAIVYFLPRDGKFNYQFSLNKPWRYGQLMATFDFPIYKDDAVVKREQDSLLTTFQPYFMLNKETEKESIGQLRTDYNASLKNILPTTGYIYHIERTLKAIYESGVMSNENIEKLRQDSVTVIKVIDGDNKETNIRFTDGIFTIKEAYEYLLTADSARYKVNVLRQASLNAYIHPNLIYDQEKTEVAKEELMNSFSWATGMVQSGQKIIDRGEIVSEQAFRELESLHKESLNRIGSNRQKQFVLVGQTLFVSIAVLCFMLYLQLFRKDYFDKPRSLSLLLALIILYCIITSLVVSSGLFHIYVVPFAMLPIIVRIFLDSRTAFMAYCTTLLICSVTLASPYEFLLLQIPAGLVSIYSLRELSQRSQLFRTAFLIVLVYFAVYFSYELIIQSNISELNNKTYLYFITNGILMLFTYPLLFLLEKLFGFTSNVTLVELSNVNNPLLRRMSETAPGTFQHSMQVANLASQAAVRIGANSQLVRTGAMYHDIGKMENPAFFTENQSKDLNPHKTLPYEESAQVVINHIKDGYRLAEKNNLPRAIKDFIGTHHGKGKTKYFYVSWMNEHPGEQPNEEIFTYPGPNPFSKETAVLMMADSVEAASRSLPEYTEESINALVDKIIDSQTEEGFFRNCLITFRDIETVKEVFKEKLMTVYHTRISYPELAKKKK